MIYETIFFKPVQFRAGFSKRYFNQNPGNPVKDTMLTRLTLITIIQLITALYSTTYNVFATESVATVEQLNTKLINETGSYSVVIHSIATLTNITVNGFKVTELSGLGWDEDENILYALSDNGYLLHLRPVIKTDQLIDVIFVDGFALKDEKSRPLKYKKSDSEGITVLNGNNGTPGDTELLVCFERYPRLVKYMPDGNMITEIKIPDPLSDIKNYRSENRSLESVTVHKTLDIMLAPEFSLNGQDSNVMTVYSINGQSWTIPLYNGHYGALVDMTTMPDGSLLLLERSYGGLFPVMDITLHRFTPDNKDDESEIIYTFSHNNGLFEENFEGITRYKGNQYFMISDDNNHPLKRILLVYFSIMKTE